LKSIHILLGALLLCGCPPPRPAERPYPPPTKEELVAHLKKRREVLRSLRAETKVDHLGQGAQRVKVTVDMLLARGGKLRLEAQAPIGGGTLMTLTADGTTFQLLDVKNNRFLEGPAKACNVARLISIEMEPEDVVDALTGSAPLEGEPVQVAWDAGRERLELRTPDGGSERIWLDARDKRWDVLSAERRDASGKLVWSLEHDGFEDKSGIRLPSRTDLKQPPKADARIKFRDVEVNPTPPAKAFHLDPPAKITVEPADC
jgi:outer membrane lipoprotein-sorting protein